MIADLFMILVFLLPGFIGVGAFRILAVTRKFTGFDYAMLAFLINAASLSLFWIATLPIGWLLGNEILPVKAIAATLVTEGSSRDLIYAIAYNYIFSFSFVVVNLISLGIAAGMSAAIIHNKIFVWLQKLNITNQTGRMDIWQDTCERHSWVIVTTKDDRKFFGYLHNFSEDTDSDKRELSLLFCRELTETEDKLKYIQKYYNTKVFYIKGSEIKYIEVVYRSGEEPDTSKNHIMPPEAVIDDSMEVKLEPKAKKGKKAK